MQDNDLISRDAAKKIVSFMVCAPTIKIAAEHEIDDLPAIDVAPVRHGRWLVDENPHDGDVRCSRCSVCIDALHERHWPTLRALGYTLSSFYPYCPHCGAVMREDNP